MTQSPENIQIYERKLQMLRQKFIEGLHTRILTLEQYAIEFRAGENNHEVLDAIRHECHKLAGVAASFGFPDIGSRASEIDTAITSGTMTRDGVSESLEDLMNEMEDLLDNAQTNS
ncbi:Hpt domain-containing protein [Ruegeria profundi]|uniref:Hpt domain-containing protein n=1 Tax=Ruegeria profundi TaxID=1685378 RepID=UPI001CD2E596|nr:Hpt domain-containing protein [Ruegeria profundi]MCA0928063.1 Hpt domain-containing protein [Ruegeria profundi]